ncbi:MAG TPA: DUF480 domain-containing protein, partial [Burkholderiaceae bacterium]|nr:DUF480 domain-containing protein [Burkholderiaceae bacterium]
RGPQTAAELRLNTERLHRFADISAVEGFLDELATREPPLVARLPRVPGARELRWAHLLSGPIALSVPGAGAAPAGAGAQRASSGSDLADLQAEHARMQAEIDALRSQVQRLAAALGVDLDPA